MEDEHREAIRRNISSLVNQTDLDRMRAALYEKGIFTEHNMETYNDTSSTPMHRKRCMYNDLMRRGPHAFSSLLEALEENGYWDLVRMLDPNSTLNTFSTNSSQKENPNKFVSLHESKTNNEKEKHRVSNENGASAAATTAAPAAATAAAPAAASSTNNNNVTPNFEVKKSDKYFDDNQNSDIGVYERAGKARGVLLMFSYISFRHDVEEYRAGASLDVANLKYLFGEMGFKILNYENLELAETRRRLAQLSDMAPPAPRCVFIVVSSHGHERAGSSDTDIRCHDGGLLPLREIISYFSNDKLPLLSDVPKVFIFQTCRGTMEDYTVRGPAPAPLLRELARDCTAVPPARAAAPPALLPPFSNVLVVQSTLPGFVSRRDPERGSWYIQALCEVFAARAHDCHVDKLFTLVDEKLRARFHIQTSSVDRWGFNRRLYLHPGLHD